MKPVLAKELPMKGVSILLYGLTDTGKSSLVATYPGIVVLDAERKPMAYQQSPNDILYVATPTVTSVIEGMKWCLDNKRSCAIDSISELQTSWNINYLKDPDSAPKSVVNQWDKDKTPNKERMRDKMEMQDWGILFVNMTRMGKQMPVLKDAGLDVIVIAQATETDEEGRAFDEYKYMPAVQGQTRRRMGHWFDAVGYCRKEVGKEGDTYTVTFGSLASAFTKDVWGKLSRVYNITKSSLTKEDLTMKLICDKLRQ